MIQLVKTPTNPVFYDLLTSSNDEIVLCAPFIKEDVVDDILFYKKEKAKLTIITSSNIANFIQGSSDLKAIDKLIQHHIVVKNYQNLHAKIYLFDSMKALITSANLTNSGMNRNYEYGVLIEKDNESLDTIKSDFIEMLDSELCGEFKIDEIKYLEKTIKSLEKEQYYIKDKKGDKIVEVQNYDLITKELSPWQKDVFDIVCLINNDEFSLNDLYSLKQVVEDKHRSNHNVEAKIRQILQQLRDRGLIKFTARGKYKKLFLIGKDC